MIIFLLVIIAYLLLTFGQLIVAVTTLERIDREWAAATATPKKSSSLEDVCVWADGTWCYREELPSMTHMSDDYYVLRAGTESHLRFIYEV